MSSIKRRVIPPSALEPAGRPAGSGLGGPEGLVIVIVITCATVLTVCGLPAEAVLSVLAGAGALGARLAVTAGA